jgi:hypothetical protein
MVRPEQPAERAPVRPRVVREGSAVPLLLEDEIAELLRAGRGVQVFVRGRAGLGKTTALAHLAAVFAGEPRLRLCDGREVEDRSTDTGEDTVTVCTSRTREGDGLRFELQPWTDDDVLEYLLAAHPARVAAAFPRWRAGEGHDLLAWPGLCRRVLDVMAHEVDAAGPWSALLRVVRRLLEPMWAEACDHALHSFSVDRYAAYAAASVPALEVPHVFGSSSVRGVLAAHRLLEIAVGQVRVARPEFTWPAPLRRGIEHTLRSDADVAAKLADVAGRVRLRHKAKVFSTLCTLGPGHRPGMALRGDMSRSWLRGINLVGASVRARLMLSVLTDANLQGARFDRCDLPRAELSGCRAEDAQFARLRA